MRKPEPSLSPEARKALLDRVASRQTAIMTAPPEAPPKSSLRAADLDGYSEMRMIRSVQEGLGLETPYYRLHDHMDGARASIGGRTLLSFSGYDYLGLNSHQAVRDAAKNAIDKYGISAMASRITAGDRMPHRDLERGIANFIGTDDCVTMVSGHATNVTTIGQLLHAGDLIVFDALAHNSIVIGAKLSGADRLSFAHNDLDDLERLLSSHRARHKRALIVIEGLYSMDGDLPHLPRLIEMKNRFGAWLMVDDAHGLGVLGATGRGLAEHWGVDPRDVDIWMGTLSKSLAGCGGYIAGSADVIDYLRHMVSGHVYSVGMPPSLAASALAALNVLRREPERVAELNAKGRQFTELARARGFDTGTAVGSAIVPMIIGDSLKTATLAERLFHAGLYVMPIMPPGVPDHTARLRFFITLHHSDADLRQAVEMVAAAANDIGGFAGITGT